MNKRGFIIGLGTGLLIASCITLVAYMGVISGLVYEKPPDEATNADELKEWVESKAAGAEADGRETDDGEGLNENRIDDDELKGSKESSVSGDYGEDGGYKTDARPEAYEEARTVAITIEDDDSHGDVASKLYKEGVIEDSAQFKSFLDVKTLYIKYKSGTYEIKTSDSYDEILDKISKEQ